jgi:peroxiredoxin
MGFYDLKAELPSGQTYDFTDLKGKVVLIVNVASKWSVVFRLLIR